MSRIFYITAAAAMFASVTAFAQTDKPAAAPDTAASAPADSSMPADKTTGKMHHHHKMMKSAKNGNTDMDADKLNSCMSNATPTSTQESCLKQAEGKS